MSNRQSGYPVTLAALVLATTAYHPVAIGQVDEIFVTARKIDENIQDVPVSVSAFTATTIQQLNLNTLDDIAKFTPGFSFTSAFGRQPGSDRPAIRGITTVVNGIANSSAVGYFVDGVYLGGSPQSTELFNLERVEVIKGPQAAQFGRGTYAGAINYVTRKPSMEGIEGGITGTGAEHDTWEASGWVSGPLVENKLAFYVAAGYDTYGGEFDNQATGDEVGGTETTSATGKLLWTPMDGLEVTLKGGIQQTEDDHFAIYLQGRSNNNCFFRSADTPRSREYYCGEARLDENGINLATELLENAENGLSGVELDRELASLTVSYTEPSGFNFTSTTGYVNDDVETGFDVSYAFYDPVPIGASAGSFYQLDEDESDIFTQEFRLSSPLDAPVRATGGVYFLKAEDEEVANRKVLATGVAALQTVANLTTEKVRNVALFAGVEADVTERLTLGLEGRYSQDRIEVANVTNNGTGAVEPCGPDPSCEETFNSLTPRVTGRFRLTDDINLYANIARGNKPGDFNATVPLDPDTGQPDESFRDVDEETMWSYELGAKTEWFERRLVANVAVYYNDVEDQQLTTNIEGPGGVPQSVLANVGKTEVWGVELETNFVITDNWTGGFMYAWTDSEIKERFSSDQADLVGSVDDWQGSDQFVQEFGSVAGKQSPRIPENQFALFTRYELPVNWGNLYFGADFTFEESKFAQEHNLIETGDRELLGARIGTTWGSWDFFVWGKNLTDNDTPLDVLRYIDRRAAEGGPLASCNSVLGAPATPTLPECSGQSTSARGFALTLQPGRQIGATINYKFGG